MFDSRGTSTIEDARPLRGVWRTDLGSALLVVMAAAAILFVTAAAVVGVVVFQQTQQSRAQAITRATGLAQQGMEVYLTALRIDPGYLTRVRLLAGIGEDGTWTVSTDPARGRITAVGCDTDSGIYHVIRATVKMQDFSAHTISSGGPLVLGALSRSDNLTISGSVQGNSTIDLKQNFPVLDVSAPRGKIIHPEYAQRTSVPVAPIPFSELDESFRSLYAAASTRDSWTGDVWNGRSLSAPLSFYREDRQLSRNYWGVSALDAPSESTNLEKKWGNQPDLAGVGIDFGNGSDPTGPFYVRSVWPPYAAGQATSTPLPTPAQFRAFAQQDPTWNTADEYLDPDNLAGRSYQYIERGLNPNNDNVIYVGGDYDVYVTGKYSRSVTIVCENDIYIIGSVTRSTDAAACPTATLGLVAGKNIHIAGALPTEADTAATYDAPGFSEGLDYERGDTSEPQAAGAVIPDNADMTIQAAMLAIDGAITMDPQDPTAVTGEKPPVRSGKLRIIGSLSASQGLKGPNFAAEAAANGGFTSVDISDDQQLRDTPPPRFPSMGTGALSVTRWDEFTSTTDPNAGLAFPPPVDYRPQASVPANSVEATYTPTGDDGKTPVTLSNAHDIRDPYFGEARITLTAVDFGDAIISGIARTWYIIDGGEKKYGDTFNLDPPAPNTSETHTVEFGSIDRDDNREATRTATFVMIGKDTELPDPATTVRDSHNPGVTLPDGYPQAGDPDYVVYGTFYPEFTAIDTPAGTGAQQIVIKQVNDPSELTPEGRSETPLGLITNYDLLEPARGIKEIDYPATGFLTRRFEYYAIDAAGNRERTRSLTIKQHAPDLTAPITFFDASPFYVGQAVIHLTGIDDVEGQGLKDTFYQLDDEPWVQSTANPTTITVDPPYIGQTPVTHTLRYYSRDKSPAQNTEGLEEGVMTTPTIEFTVAPPLDDDTTDPVTTSDAKASYVGPATIMLSSSDEGGVRQVYWSLDDGPTQTGVKIEVPAPWTGSVDHHIDYWAVDLSGNDEDPKTDTFTVTPERTFPVTTAHNFELYTGPAVFQLTAEDAGSSGLAGTYYKIDDGEYRLGTGMPGLTWVTVTGDGLHTVSFYSVDNAENAEAPKSTTLRIDSIAPVTTDDALSTPYVGQAVIDLTASDSGSGVKTTMWRNSADGLVHTSDQVLLGAGANWEVTYWSTDNAGNVESPKTLHADVTAAPDHTAPESFDAITPYYKFPSPATLNLYSWDVQSGVARMRYALDGVESFIAGKGNPPDVYQVLATGDGTHTIEYWAEDKAGNVESPRVTKEFYLDSLVPTTTCSARDQDTVKVYWSSQTFVLTATDSGSGVNSTYYALDGGLPVRSLTVYVPAPTDGYSRPHVIQYWSTDRAGNVEPVKSFSFTSKPTDTIAPATFSNAKASYDGAAVITLSAQDNLGGSGVAHTYWRIHDGATVSGSAPANEGTLVGISGSGQHTLEFWSVDTAGNAESPHKTITYNMDGVAPTTSSDARPLYDAPALIHLTAADNSGGSDVAETYFRIDGGAVAAGTPPVTTIQVTAEGQHTIDFWSVDIAGNTESTKTASFNIDMTDPTTVSDAVASYAGTATVALNATDNPGGSGVQYTYYRVDDGARQSGTTIVVNPPATGAQTHIIHFWSVDNVENTETQHDVSLTVTAVANMTFSGMTPPENGTTAVRNPTVSVVADADQNISSVTALIDGKSRPATLVYGGGYWITGGYWVDGYWDWDDCDTWWVDSYYVDTSVWVPANNKRATASFQASGLTNGSHVVAFTFVNATGASKTKSWSFTVTAPADLTKPITTSNAVATYQTTATISLLATDGANGTDVVDTFYRLNGGAQQSGTPLTTTITVGASGKHTLEYWSVDGAGNIETHKTSIFWVDRTAPTTNANALASYSGTANISLTATDGPAGSGVRYTYYKVDSGAQSSGSTFSVPAPTSGAPVSHTITFWSVDVAGNVEDVNTATFSVSMPPDHTPPTTTSNAVATYTKPSVITLTAVDNVGGWGVANTYYRLDGETTQTGNAASTGGEGPHTLLFWSTDSANNTETVKSVNFTVFGDTTPPVTTANAMSFYTGPATIALSATDIGWGVAHTHYRIDGGAEATGTSITVPAPVVGSVTHDIYYWSVDLAGNIESVRTARFDVLAVPYPMTFSAMTPAEGAMLNSTNPTVSVTAKADQDITAVSAMLDGLPQPATIANPTGSWLPAHWETAVATIHGTFASGNQWDSTMSWGPDWFGEGDVGAWSCSASFDLSPYGSTATFSNAGLAWTYGWPAGNGDQGQTKWVDNGDGGRLATWSVSSYPTTVAGFASYLNAHKGGTVTFQWDADAGDYENDVWGLERDMADPTLTFQYQRWVEAGWSGGGPDLTTATGSFPTSGLTSGIHTAAMTFTVASGAQNTKTWTFSVDTVPPVTTSNAAAAYTGSATIALTATDNIGGSGVKNTFYRVDSGAQQTGTTIVVPPPTSGSASHTIHYWSVDNAGNTEAQNSKTFTSNALPDTTPPVTVPTYQAVYAVPATITLTATDNVGGWGVANTYYKLDTGAVTTGTAPVTLVGTGGGGQHTLEFWSVDAATNIESPHKTISYAVTPDTTPPTTTSNAQAAYMGSAVVSLTATDNVGGWGVAHTYYTVNGGAATTGTAITIPAPFNGSSTVTITYWSVDRANNVEPVTAANTRTFTVTAIPPTFTFTGITPPDLSATRTVSPQVSITGQGLQNISAATATLDGSPRTVTLTYATQTSTTSVWVVSGYSEWVDDGTCWGWERWVDTSHWATTTTTTTDYKKVTASFPTSGLTNGTHSATVIFTLANGQEAPKSWSFIVDTIKPTTTTTASVAATYTGTATFSLIATDNVGGSGVAATYYRIGAGAQVASTTVVVPAPTSGSADRTITYWSVDRAGNIEDVHSHNITSYAPVDTTPPMTVSNVKPYYKAPSSITMTATDIGWGVAHTFYRLDGGAVTTGTAPVTTVGTGGVGTHTIEYWSTDLWGHVEPHHSATYIVDMTAPVTTSTAVPTYTVSATINLNATDEAGGSGVAYTNYKLDSAAATSGTVVTVAGPVSGSAPHTLLFWSVDRAGNIESQKSVTFTVQAQPASMTFSNLTPAEFSTVTARNPAVSVTAEALVNITAVTATLDGVAKSPVSLVYASMVTTSQVWVASGSWVAGTPIWVPAEWMDDGCDAWWEPAHWYTPNNWVDTSHYEVQSSTVTNNKKATASFSTSGLSDGIHTVSMTFTVTGGAKATRTWTFTVSGPDNTAPTTVPTYQSSYVGTATITLTATDTAGGSGVKYTYYRKDGGAQTAGTPPVTTIIVAPPAWGAPVSHTIVFWSVDNLSNTETQKSITFTVAPMPDTTRPTTTSSAVPTYTGNANITLTATDNPGGWGVASTWYKIDDGSQISGTSITVAAPAWGSAVHHIDFWSIDRATNTEVAKTATFTVNAVADNTDPVTGSNALSVYPAPSTITLSPSDVGWGIAATYYKLDTGAVTAGTSVATGGQGSHTLLFWSVDRAGRTEATKTANYVVDMTKPVTTSNAMGAYTGSASITLAATDVHSGASGVQSTFYKVDGGAQTSGTSISVAGPVTGLPVTHTITFWSVDRANNVEVAKTATFTVSPPADSTAPTTTSNRVPFYAVPGTILLTATDNIGGWGVAHTYYIRDGAAQAEGTSVATGGSGQHTLEFWSVDWATNVETPHKTVSYNVDMTPPTTSSNALSSYTGTATVSLTAVDNSLGSGVQYTYYKVDGGTQAAGTTVVVAPPTWGSVVRTITFWSVDNMGNSEVQKTATFTVNALPDTTAPNTVSNAVPVYSKPATITLTATDAGWGVTSITYILDGAAPVTGYTNASGGTATATCLVGTGGGGPHTLEFWSGDKAGNGESPHKTVTYTVTPDTTPPVTTSNAVALYIGPATIALTATDSGWGVANTYYKVDSGAWTTGTTINVPAPVAGSVVHTLQFYSTDQAGNIEATTSVSFTVAGIPANMTFSNLTPADGAVVTTGNVTVSVRAVADQNMSASAPIIVLDGVVRTPTTWTNAGTVGTASYDAFGALSLDNGTHTVAVTFTNASGQQATKAWSFTVAIQTDFTAPVTTSNAMLGYIGTANVTLTAADNVGGSGVRYTYYTVDGGAQKTGTIITVPGPVSGAPVAHTITFWSVDYVGNTESPSSASFTIAPPDTIAPVSSSNAKAYYNAPSTIQLSAIDNINGSGVAHIYYRLDGAPQVEGTLLGTGGIGSHVLEFWAVDNAGLAESPHHTVTYKVDATAPSTISDAKAAYTGVAVINLTAQDEVGGSGLKYTFYRIDSGVPISGSTIAIQPPVFAADTHTVSFWSVDNAGNVESSKSASFTVSAVEDVTAPVTSSDAKASYAVPGLITLTAVDGAGGWGVDRTYYRLDGGAQTEGSAVRTGGVGSHTLVFWSVDRADNTETHKSVTYDVVAPDTTKPVTLSDAVSSYVGAATIRLTATDNSLATPVTHFRVDSGPDTTGTVATIPAPVAGAVSHTLYFWSVDINGNVETLKNAVFTVNAQPANMTFSGMTPAEGSTIGVRNPTIVVGALSPSNSIVGAVIEVDGIAKPTSVSLNVKQATASFPAVGLTNGGHTVSAIFTDSIGATSVKTWSFTVTAPNDVTAPSTTSDGATTYAGTAQIRLFAADEVGGRGVASTSYKLNGGSTLSGTPPTTTITVSAAGNHSIEYWSTDAAGNIELPHKTLSFSIDTLPPTTSSDAGNGYTGTAVIRLTANDNANGSGVKATYYRIDTGAQQTGNTITVPAPATASELHTIYWWSVDNANNVEPMKSATFKVWALSDTIAPTTTSNAQTTYSVPGVIMLAATDNVGGSGVAHTYYRLDGGAETEGTIVGTGGQGSHTVEFWSVDLIGNVETPHKTATYTVAANDTVAPTTASNAVATYGGPAQIMLTATDNAGGSGVAHTYYRADNGPVIESTLAGVTGSGTHRIEFWSVDWAGNTEVIKTADFVIDITAPVTTTNALASYAGAATVTLTPADTGGVGVRSTFYRLDGGPVQTGLSITIAPPASGTVSHTIEFWSVDDVGNAEGSKSVTFNVGPVPDAAAPTTTSNAVPSYTGTATIVLTPVDTGSGVKATYYSVDGAPQQTGTTIVIGPPASGAAAHTITWWSVDNSDNTEAVRSFNITVNAAAAVGTATLSFRWEADDYGTASLHVENASGQWVASKNLAGYGSDLFWDVPVPAGQSYRMVCDEFWDDYNEEGGGGYGVWSDVLTPNQIYPWNY